MTVFWQHVGDSNSVRDFPRTLGTPAEGLCEFSTSALRPYLSDLGPLEDAELERNFERIGSTVFQVWGLPTGPKDILKPMIVGDYLLLLDTNAEGGAFRYFGRVLYRLPSEQWHLSSYLWKESSYPIIVLTRGHLIKYPWIKFLGDFEYGSGLKPMGRTYRIAKQTMSNSRFTDEGTFYETITAEYAAQMGHLNS